MDGQKNITEKTLPRTTGRRVTKLVLKTLMWTVIAMVSVVVLALGCVVWILTPERLTPIVERYANEYVVNSSVDVGRVELTFWSTFPRLRVDVDSLSVTSHSLDSVETRVAIPADASQLLSVDHFHAGINVLSLVSGNIEVYDVELRRPMVNIVALDDTLTNMNIFPPSVPDTAVSEPINALPDIRLDRFAIVDALPLRYRSVADSIDVGITLCASTLAGDGAPQYILQINGDASALLPPTILEPDVPVGVNGKIDWSPQSPMAVSLSDFVIDVAELHSTLNASFDFSDRPMVNTLEYKVHRLSLADAMSHLPKDYRKPLEMISTDLTVSAGVKLSKPYVLTDSVLPSADVTLDVHEGHLMIGNKHKPLTISASVAANIAGENLDASVVKVKSCKINGVSINADLNGTFSSLMSDPAINARFDGEVFFDNLPPAALRLIPGKITGRLSANTAMKLRMSHLSKGGFHKARLNGEATLHDFTYTDSLTDFYTLKSTFRFGLSNSFVRDNHRVDSLLTASIKVDTASVKYSGMDVSIGNFLAGVGCKNVASSTDSTTINPIGGTIKIERLVFRSDDSTRVGLREVDCNASLRRFKDNNKVPQLNLSMNARRISYGDPLNRVNLTGGKIDMTAHLRPRRRMSPRMQARFDSVAQAHPDMPVDSVYKLIMPRRNRTAEAVNSDEMLDFALDNTTKDLLRRWNVTGRITARRGRLFTPYFPLRNRLSDIDVSLTTDSIVFRDVKYNVGRSDFRINGRIDNIRRALTSRRGRTPLEINLYVSSDTIDVNQLAEAAFTGAAFAQKAASQDVVIANIENEDSLQEAIDQLQDTAAMAAIVIPRNLTASFNMRARNVIYADMLMRRFRGNVLLQNGALNMQQLSAATDMGSIGLSALYNAPDRKNINFGFGMQIKDLQLDKFLKMIPAVDSLMPMMKNFDGIINADIAATSDVDSAMNLMLPTLNAAIKLHGDSLVLLDADTFKMLSKWLLFKNKKRNMIDNVDVEILVENSMLELFPFMFDIDRYRLGVMGSNDLAFNFNYHVSVLKSPLPFKFGLNVSGNADDMKIRVGKAKFKENMVTERVAIVDTTRVNLLNQIENVFRRGVKLGKMQIDRKGQSVGTQGDIGSDTISHADSLLLIKEGLLPPTEPSDSISKNTKRRRR